MFVHQSDTVRIAALFKGWTLLILPPGLKERLINGFHPFCFLLAENTGFEPIPTESGHEGWYCPTLRVYLTRPTFRRPHESLLCYLYTNPQCVTPFWFRSNVLTELLADDIGLTTNLASGAG